MLHFWRKTPAFKGKKRLLRFLYKKQIAKFRDINVNIKGLQFTLPNLKESISFDLFFDGVYEKDLIDFLIKNIPKNGAFIDVGANIGAISILVASARPDVKIFAFEASPFVYSYLKINVVSNNFHNITHINRAIHNIDNLEMDFFSPEDLYGKGSFSPVFTTVSEKVKTLRLDNYFTTNSIIPDYIKVDVEGYEKLIFESLGDFLTGSKKPIIIFEFVDWAEKLSELFNPGDAQFYLSEKGYNLYDFDKYQNNKNIPELKILSFGSAEIIAISNNSE